MKYIQLLLISIGFLQLSTTLKGAIILDFTVAGTGNSSAGLPVSGGNTSLTGVDLGGGRTVDVLLDANNAISNIAVGVGVSGGDEGNRIGASANETVTITFSNATGFNLSDLELIGLVASTEPTSGVFSFEGGDVLNINGQTITGTDDGDGTANNLNFSLDDYVFQNLDSGGTVALNGSDAFVLDLTTNAGSGYRLQALNLRIIPEPRMIVILLILGCIFCLTFRKKRAALVRQALDS